MADYPLQVSHRHRHRLAIMAKILEVAKEGTPKTQVMYQASLSFSQLNEYLSFLLNRNLLEAFKASKKTTYKTTGKGLRYLRQYIKIVELLKEGKGNKPREANLLHLI